MKTYLIFDTNTLSLGKAKTMFGVFSMKPILLDLLNKIEKNLLSDRYQVLIPQIVVEELKQQQLEAFNVAVKELKSLSNRMEKLYYVELNEKYILNYEDQLNEMLSSFTTNNNINILNICNDSKLSRIVERAITKKPPFRGEQGKSDKGFKDVLIWESLIEFAEKNIGNYIYITNDGDYLSHKKYLVEEFSSLTNNSIEFIKPESLESTPNIIDKAINDKEQFERLTSFKACFYEIQEELNEDLKLNCFNTIDALGNKFMEIEVEFFEPNIFSEINESLFSVTIPSKVTLDDTGIHYEVSVKIKVEFIFIKNLIKSIKLVETSATLLNGKVLDDFMVEPYEKELSNSKIEKEQTHISEKSYIKNNKQYEKNIYFKNVINEVNLGMFFKSIGANINTDKSEIIRIIEESTQIDWYTFPNKEAILKTEIKKLLRKNNENVQVIDKLTEDLISFTKNAHMKFDEGR